MKSIGLGFAFLTPTNPPRSALSKNSNSVDVSDIFYFFLFWAGGKEEASEEVAGGVGFNKK